MTEEKNYLAQVLGPLNCQKGVGCARVTHQSKSTLSSFSGWTVKLEEAKSDGMQMPIFGFAEFIGAMALLAVVYTMSDFKYRFRAAVAPFPLKDVTSYVALFVGGGTLLSNWWFAEGWMVPNFMNSLPTIQTLLGVIFLLQMAAWVHYTFHRPTRYGTRNCKKFASEVNRTIVHGNREELTMLADEIARSAKEIIALAPSLDQRREAIAAAPNLSPTQLVHYYTNELLKMISSPRMTDAMASTSGLAAILLFQEAAQQRKFDVNLAVFSRNLVASMLENRTSLMYMEEHLHEHGYLGQMKYFRTALFGCYPLIEGQGGIAPSTPLDAQAELPNRYDAEQMKVYGDCFLVTFKNYLRETYGYPASTALNRFISNAVQNAEGMRFSVDASSDFRDSAQYRFWIVGRILSQTMEALDQDYTKRERKPDLTLPGMLTDLGMYISDFIKSGAYVKGDEDSTWTMHYSTLWLCIFFREKGAVSAEIQRKVLKQLMNEIRTLERSVHYVNARVFAFAINIAGFKKPTRMENESETLHVKAFRLAVQNWTRKHLLSVLHRAPAAIDELLPPGITYDEKRAVLIRRYKGLLSQSERTAEFVLDRKPKMSY